MRSCKLKFMLRVGPWHFCAPSHWIGEEMLTSRTPCCFASLAFSTAPVHPLMAGVAELLGKAQRWAVPAAQVHAVAKKKKKVGHAGGGDDDDDVDSGASGSSGSSGDDSGDDGEDEEDGHRRSHERSSGGASQGPCHRTQRPGGSESGGRIDGGQKDSSAAAAAAAAAAARRFEALQDAWARHLLPGTQTPRLAPAVPSMPRVAEEGAVVEASKEKAAGSAGAAAALAAGASVALVGPVAALAEAVDTAGAAPRARPSRRPRAPRVGRCPLFDAATAYGLYLYT